MLWLANKNVSSFVFYRCRSRLPDSLINQLSTLSHWIGFSEETLRYLVIIQCFHSIWSLQVLSEKTKQNFSTILPTQLVVCLCDIVFPVFQLAIRHQIVSLRVLVYVKPHMLVSIPSWNIPKLNFQ
jgi:hypothetical protein